MNLSLRERLLAAASLALAAACSSSSSDDTNVANTVTQDLTADPNGFVTAVRFDEALSYVGAGAFEADGGQTALSVSLDGEVAYVTWDARVNADHRVRVVGVDGVLESWHRVAVQDARRPEVSIVSATQDTSDQALGGDELVIAFTDGPDMIEAEVEDPESWALVVADVTLDLSDSTFDFDDATQVLTVTLGPSAHLHASFGLRPIGLEAVTGRDLANVNIAGAAVGDSDAPALEGGSPVAQNLDAGASGDELGRVIEFDFDEPISPVFGVASSSYAVVDHVNAVGMTLVTSVEIDPTDNSLVRVTYSRPVVPGLDQIQLSSLRDAHGNVLPTQTVAVDAGSSVANGFESMEGVTVPGLENDQVVVVLDQALDPDTADDPALWTLTLGAPFGVIDLTTQTVTYDLLTRTVTFGLDFDVPNGTTVDVDCAGAVDVDGDTFTASAPQALAAGDSTAPSVTANGITQRRDLDPSGRTIDVVFSEGVDELSAADDSNYSLNPAVVVDSAALQADGVTVRLALAEAAIPGDHELTVSASVADPAGNTLGAVHGPASIASTDTTAPSVQIVTAVAVEGANNDLVHVLFNDWMVPADVEDVSNWTVESPVGSALDLSTSAVTYDDAAQIATLVLDGAAMKRGDDLSVAFTAGRDLAGNSLDDEATEGAVGGENRRPAVESVWRQDAPNDHVVVVRFTEASDRLTDLYDATTNPTGVKYTVYSNTAVLRGRPTSAAVVDDGLGVALSFPFTVALTDTLDIVGLEDLAGNVMFPTLARVIDAEDSTAPSQAGAPVMTAVSGERNDTLEVTFAVPMATWGLLEPSQYTLQESGGGDVIDLAGSTFSYDGNTTLVITLSASAAASLQSGTTYDLVLEVDAQDPLRTAQGVAIGASNSELNVAVVGDVANGPTQGASRATLDPNDPNSVLVTFDEAVDETAAETAAAYDYDGGNVAVSASLLSPRVVRATFGTAVSAGNTLEVATSAAVDLAGNAAAATLSLSIVDDQAAPVLSAASGEVLAATGTDSVTVRFNEMVDLDSALDISHYSLIDSRGSVTIQGVLFDSANVEVTLLTADLLDGDTFTVFVDGVMDVAGNLPALPLSLGGSVGGDNTPPAIAGAFTNLALDAAGLTVDVAFSEAVLEGVADEPTSWATSGSATVTAVEVIGPDHVRLTLSQALGATDELELDAGLTDRAGNAAGALTVDPAE